VTPLFERAVPCRSGFRDLSVTEAFASDTGARLIDVREPDEFQGELGHIPGAELVPLGLLRERSRDWPRDRELIVVCRSGGRSLTAAGLLAKLGFERVMNLAGGMIAYRAAGLPIERG
jgi:rhodanese-related sulfurtransferase